MFVWWCKLVETKHLFPPPAYRCQSCLCTFLFFSFPTSGPVYSARGTAMFLVAAACTLGVMTGQKLGICHSELLLSQVIERKKCKGFIFWGLAYIPSRRTCTLAFPLSEPIPVRRFVYHRRKYITDWWLEQLEKDCKAFAMSCLLVVSYGEPGSSLLNLLIVRDRKITFKKEKKKGRKK